jgi:hypothetical protein
LEPLDGGLKLTCIVIATERDAQGPAPVGRTNQRHT